MRKAEVRRPAQILLAIAALFTAVGIVTGISSDIWGWWPYPLLSGGAGLWLIARDESSRYRKAAKYALIAIGIVLAVLAVLGLAFVIWFSSFTF